MAITRRWQAGFESAGLDSEYEWNGGSGGAPAVGNTQAKTGVYSAYVTGSTGAQYFAENIPATRQARLSAHAKTATGITATNVLLSWYSAGGLLGRIIVTTAITFEFGLEIAGVVQDTAINAVTVDQWCHYGIDIKIDGVAGWVRVYKDGILILEFDGNTGNADLVQFRFLGIKTGLNTYYDDIYIDDTTGEAAPAPVPDLRFGWVQAETGAAQYNAWTGSDGNSVDNYALIDDNPHNSDTDYIEAASTDLLNTTQLSTMALPGGMSIKAVIPTVYAKKTDGAVDTHIALIMYGAATDVTGADQELPTSYSYLWERWVAKPGGGAWDQAALDALQGGVKSRGSY